MRIKKKPFLTVLLFLLLLPAAVAGEDSWEVYLSQRSVVQAARDGRYLYFATGGGGLRWDTVQQQYEAILPNDGLPSVNVVSVAVDRLGNKWFGHGDIDLGVSVLDAEGRWRVISSFEGLLLTSGKKVNTIYAVGDSVWVGTESGATLFEAGERKSVVTQDKEGIISDNILSITSGGGKVWFGTDKGLSRYSRGEVRNYRPETDDLPSMEVISLAVDRTGKVWVGTPNGIAWVVDGEASQPLDFVALRPYAVRAIAFEDSSGADVPWFATNNGPYRNMFQQVQQVSGTPMGNVDATESILIDEGGDIWACNSRRFMFEWQAATRRWAPHVVSGDISSNYVGELAIDRNHDIWCAMEGNVEGPDSPGRGISVLKGNTWYAMGGTILGTTMVDVDAVAIDSAGNRWFGVRRVGETPGNLIKIAASVTGVPGTEDLQFFDLSGADGIEPRNQAVFSVEVDPDNNKWAAITRVGVGVVDSLDDEQNPGSLVPPCIPNDNENLGPSSVDITFSSDGRVWLATEANGIHAVNTLGTLTFAGDDRCRSFFKETSPLPDNSNYAIRADDKGNVWVGSFGGLVRFSIPDSIWTVYTEFNTGGSLPDNRVRAIAFDGRGNTWVGTFGGGLACLLADGETWLEPWRVIANSQRGSSLTSDWITSLQIVKNDLDEEEIWISTWGGGICKLVVDWTTADQSDDGNEERRITAYPNPYRWGEETEPGCASLSEETVAFHDVASIDTTDGEVRIEIYTVTGEPVRTIEEPQGTGAEAVWCWDLRNEENVPVASGVYLFVVKRGDEVYHVGRTAVLR
ncbi:MAG: hypothetical protein JW958_11090 [Candidatus Eisenbacteria bacterium]|nr:hypothetical protein [Candidatus Eisenbacteria bacterium]